MRRIVRARAMDCLAGMTSIDPRVCAVVAAVGFIAGALVRQP